MAQTAGALVLEHYSEHAGKLVFFTSIDRAKFRRPVGPGDTVHFHVRLAAKRPPIWEIYLPKPKSMAGWSPKPRLVPR